MATIKVKLFEVGSKVKVITEASDYYRLIGTISSVCRTGPPRDIAYIVHFAEIQLKRAKRPQIVLRARNTVYFYHRELVGAK